MPIADTEIFRVAVKQDLKTIMRDGTVLRTDVYRPDADGLFPTLVCRTPYDKSGKLEAGHKLAERGYLVAIQDVRVAMPRMENSGRGSSAPTTRMRRTATIRWNGLPDCRVPPAKWVPSAIPTTAGRSVSWLPLDRLIWLP